MAGVAQVAGVEELRTVNGCFCLKGYTLVPVEMLFGHK